MIEIALGVTLFTGIVLALALLILAARSWLIPSGSVQLTINDERNLRIPRGGKLLNALGDSGLFLPSACGGKGTCGQCRVAVLEGGGALLPTESAILSRREAASHLRLACQVAVRENLEIRVPEEIFGIRRWPCTVRSNRNVSTFIKELVLDLPEDNKLEFRAGGYVQIECPAYELDFATLPLEPRFRPEWERLDLLRFRAGTTVPVSRAYSMANHPLENDIVMLNVRIALPPPGAAQAPPGIVSSWIFGLAPGDTVNVSGPFGEFFARETAAEMVFIGGGAGMAPMRSHICDQLLRLGSKRKISFWYGARSKQELFYTELFDRLQLEHPNFSWHVALSEPQPQDEWTGYTGFIHQVLCDEYLRDHPAPEDCEYYLCGPPVMAAAVIHMLTDLGVERENILFDDFGS